MNLTKSLWLIAALWLAAILICTALFVWSCDGSQFELHTADEAKARFGPRQAAHRYSVMGGERLTSATLYFAFMHSWLPVATSEEASPLAVCGVSAPVCPVPAQEDSRPIKRYRLRVDRNTGSRAYEVMESTKRRNESRAVLRVATQTPSAGQFNLNP